MKALGAAGTTSKFQSAAPCVSPSGAGGVQRGWGGGTAGGLGEGRGGRCTQDYGEC